MGKKIVQLPILLEPGKIDSFPITHNGTTYKLSIDALEKFYFSNVDNLSFNINPTGITSNTGDMFWDNENQTVSLRLRNGVTLQFGQEDHTYCYNPNSYPIYNGLAVYISGSFNGVPSIDLGDAKVANKSNILGLATQNINPGEYGYVTTRGLLHDLNTSYWNDNDVLYLSETFNGGLQNSSVSLPTSFSVVVAFVIKSHLTDGILLVRQVPYHNLSNSGDVYIVNPVLNDTFKYNGEKWYNSPVDLKITLNSINGWSTLTQGCLGLVKSETTFFKTTINTIDFVPAIQTYAEWTERLPNDFISGSTVVARFYWTSDSSSPDDVIWGCQGKVFGDDLDMDIDYGLPQEVIDTNSPAPFLMHITDPTLPITITGNPIGGKLIQFRIYRLGFGADNLLSNVKLLKVIISYI